MDRDEAEAKQDEADAAATSYDMRFEKSQMWMITEPPTRNSSKGLSNKVINIPVYHFRLRTSNLSNLSGEEIANDTKLKVEFQKFSKDDWIWTKFDKIWIKFNIYDLYNP